MKQKNEKKCKRLLLNRLGDILHDSDGLITIVKLNVLFILSSVIIFPPISIFTFGPSLTALLYCTNQLVIKGYVPDLSTTYFRIFKSSGKTAVKFGAVFGILFIVFGAGLFFYLNMASDSIIYVPFASASLLGIIGIQSLSVHLFSLIGEENISGILSKELVSSAFAMVLENMVKTLISVIVSFVFIAVLILFLPASLPLLITVAFSVPALCSAFAHSVPEIPEL